MKKIILITLLVFTIHSVVFSQDHKGYQFKEDKVLKATPVRNQENTSTCWCFAGISFLESELYRMDKGNFDLSEMWVVRHAYREKAVRFVRMHGSTAFRSGGTAIDVVNIVKKFGIVPESAYPGLNYGTTQHNHGELHEALKAYIADIIKNRNAILSSAWLNGFEAIIDAYLGKIPEKFVYEGKEYTPESFTKTLNLPLDNYKVITSYTCYPENSYVQLEFPDNWCWISAYNVPFKDFTQIVHNSIDKGYTVAVAMDITDNNFMKERGIAIVPALNVNVIRPEDKTGAWENITNSQLNQINKSKENPGPERLISSETRQRGFDNYFVTDDHMVHIIGTARDQYGKKYFKIKDSSGYKGDRGKGGYVYVSETYFLYKT